VSTQPRSVKFEFELARLKRAGDYEFTNLKALAVEMLEYICELEEELGEQEEVPNEAYYTEKRLRQATHCARKRTKTNSK
jgi:hypothetical protein